MSATLSRTYPGARVPDFVIHRNVIVYPGPEESGPKA